MNSLILERQLNDIAQMGIEFDVDNVNVNSIPNNFKEITFHKTPSKDTMIKVIFANYIVSPGKDFDFHDKWNDGTPPSQSSMYGSIIKETDRMYKFDVVTEQFDCRWIGWCPKKSCVVVNL